LSLVVGLLVTFLFAVWSLSSEAKDNKVTHQDLSVSKRLDASTPKLSARQLPGQTTPGKIVLKRGKNSSMDIK
jgi:type VI protein secretion system component Hcp